MNHVKNLLLEDDVDDLADSIVKQYGKFGVNISLRKQDIWEDRTVFIVKLKGNSRAAHLCAHVPDIQLRLKLPVFRVVKQELDLFLVVSQRTPQYNHLPDILQDSDFGKDMKCKECPYVVGYNDLGNVVLVDLAEFPHLLLGGSSNSGKSVGLQALITSIAYHRSPSQVNFILMDIGAISLMPFEKLPHLSCPIVRDCTTATRVLTVLITEMERRIALGFDNPIEFGHLPRLVLLIDELPALFKGLNKAAIRMLADAISSLLQRGRHAKIHLILAAQNPTHKNMMNIDLGNITARIAFTCAKKNFSETILGEGGAENLSGQGDMLLKVPAYDLQRIQGIYATEGELEKLIGQISAKYGREKDEGFSLKIPDDQTGPTGISSENFSCSVVRKGPSQEDQLWARIIMWTLGHDLISVNMLMTTFHLGWNKAEKFVQRLEKLGIIDVLEGKLPREVIPSSFKDFPDELVKFLESTGYTKDDVITAFCKDTLLKQNPSAKEFSTPQIHIIRKKVKRRRQNLREETQAQLPHPRPKSSGNDR